MQGTATCCAAEVTSIYCGSIRRLDSHLMAVVDDDDDVDDGDNRNSSTAVSEGHNLKK